MENELNLDETIRKLILQIRDFPRAGINFTDITPILEHDPVVFRAVIDRMCGPRLYRRYGFHLWSPGGLSSG